MPRYGPAPETATPPPPPEDPGVKRWSFNRKLLAVLASIGMVAAFVFNFLSPTSSGFRKDKTTTTLSRPAPAVATSPSTTGVSSTTSTTNIPGGIVNR